MMSLIKNNERGSVLILVMAALAAVGAASFYIMNVRKNADTNNLLTKFESDLSLLVNDIQANLSNSKKCFNTFQATAQPTSIVTKVDVVSPFATVTSKYHLQSQPQGRDGFTDSKIRIERYRLTAANEFVIEFVNKEVLKGGSVNNNALKVRKIPMFVERDATNALLRCRSITNGSEELWSRSPGLPNNIYYGAIARDRWVGIGTKANLPPPAMPSHLHVIKTSRNLPAVSTVTGKPTEAFKVEGNVEATRFYYTSDKALKTNIAPIEGALALIESLRGVSFTWKHNKRHDYGFVAQEVESKIPQLTEQNTKDDIMKIGYGKLVPILVEAIKSQEEQIQSLKKRIKHLSAK
jgi:hypothetical protein